MTGADSLGPLLPDQVHLIWRKFGYKRLMPKPFVELVRMVLDEVHDAEIARGAQWSDAYQARYPALGEPPADYQADDPPPYDDEYEADERAAEDAGVYDPRMRSVACREGNHERCMLGSLSIPCPCPCHHHPVDLGHARARASAGGHPCLG